MKIKLLQLNMWAGTRFPAIKDYLEKNDFDILCFQEVSGIRVASGNILSSRSFFKRDCFIELQHILGPTYRGELAIAQYISSNPKDAYFGNAIFYKKEFALKKKDVLWLYKRATPFPTEALSYEECGRNALHLTLEKDDNLINIMCGHLAWAKDKYEYPHQREQNLKLIAYMKNMQTPWVLTGDFNIDPAQQSVLDLGKIGKNLTKEYNISNTIDPENHRAWEKIKPGFPIDYIFVSNDIQVYNFEALGHIHMSDHIGLSAEIEV